MVQNTVTHMGRNNLTIIKSHIINVVIMLLFVVAQAATRLHNWGVVLAMAVVGIIPIIIEKLYYNKNKESENIKIVMAVGFMAFYIIAIFTAVNNLVFVFAIPTLLIITIYNNIRYSIIVNAVVIISNLLLVLIGANTGLFGYRDSDSAIIQIVIILLVCVYSYISTKTLNKNNISKIQEIKNTQEETQELLNHVSELSSNMKNSINDIYEDLQKLSEVSENTKTAMQEVSMGVTETADAVQKQNIQTEAIQNKVENVNKVANIITDNMKKTLEVIEEGNKNLETLVNQVEISVKNGEDVSVKLKTLDGYMTEMNSIVELIDGITSQTGLLALNASIEAARAGEAGKGFAVVASEISEMANQTKNATVNITDLIQNVSSSINEVVEVIKNMIAGINEERSSASSTLEDFNMIKNTTLTVRENVDNLSNNVVKLKESNQEIVDSVQTISAVTEEVTAHASETMNVEENNIEILSDIRLKMKNLLNLIKE